MDDANGRPNWDSALTKYVHVWLWSILLGAATSEGYSFLSYRGERWGILGLGFVALVVLGVIVVLGALLALGRFLIGYLLPVFFANAEVSTAETVRAGVRLRQSFNYILIGLALRMVMAGVELTLNSLMGGFQG